MTSKGEAARDPAEESNVQWVARDARTWVTLATMPDQLTARMFVTMLEANELEGRVGTQAGDFVVEVPLEQRDQALGLYHPTDSSIAPPLEEARQKTGIHTGHRIRQEMATRAVNRTEAGASAKRKGWLLWAVLLALLGTLLVLALLSRGA
ncbi:MAG: hypothetical protein IPP14_14840 [Planctomycetes bacterium]|nr:hypothetical protein [Planctomycetota bacterium]